MTTTEPPPLAELLATWQTWSLTNTLIFAMSRAQAAGDTQAARRLASSLAEEPDTDPLAALAANHQLVRLLTGWQWHAIRAAREHGNTWTQIGHALGLTGEQAQAQYRHSIEHAKRYAPDYTDTTPYRAVLHDDPPTTEDGPQ